MKNLLQEMVKRISKDRKLRISLGYGMLFLAFVLIIAELCLMLRHPFYYYATHSPLLPVLIITMANITLGIGFFLFLGGDNWRRGGEPNPDPLPDPQNSKDIDRLLKEILSKKPALH